MLPEYVKFYYDAFPQYKKNVYMSIYKGIADQQERIRIYADRNLVSEDDLLYIYKSVRFDTPSFYYVRAYSYYVLGDGYEILPDYIYSREQIEDYDRKILAGLEIFDKRFIRPEMTAYEKEVAIHNYLVSSVVYDTDSIETEEKMDAHPEIYNLIGPLLRKKAVCLGISLAFKFLCDCYKIKSFVISGDSYPAEEDSSGHAWNVVKLDGEAYHVDVTWDIKDKGAISCIYDHFNLDDHLIRLNHTWDDDIYPPCTALRYNYYNMNKYYVRRVDQIAGFVAEQAARGADYITFKFAAEMPEESEIIDGIRKGLTDALRFGSFCWSVSTKTHNIYIDLDS